MYAFFCNLYFALFNGSWVEYTSQDWYRGLMGYVNSVHAMLVNMFGGEFPTYQEEPFLKMSYFPTGTNTNMLTPQAMICAILSLVTLLGVCVAVWKITKALFAVFFRGAR